MKISIHNTAELDLAIHEAAGTARKHIHTAKQAEQDALGLFEKLKRHLSARLLVGTTLRLSSQPSLPRSYGNNRVIHTRIDVEIFNDGLYVVSIKKEEALATTKQTAKAVAFPPSAIVTYLKDQLYREAARI
jgi:hypothetical protein